jgi:hypothetical protein
MSKKLYAAFVPLLAALAFAAMPAVAQAAPEWEACKEVAKETGKFTTIKCNVEKAKSNFEKILIGNLGSAVLVASKNVAGKKAVLKSATADIECTTVKDESWLWNSRGRGRDINEIDFSGCKGSGAVAECKVAEPIVVEASTRLEEESGEIYNKYFAVSGEPLAEITLSGATCPAPGTFPVTGTARGEIAVGGGRFQKFNPGEKTLEFGGPAEFTGETEQEGPGGAGIFVT